MKHIFTLIVILLYQQFGFANTTPSIVTKNHNTTVVKNTVEQLNYLVKRNANKNNINGKSPWYIYILGGDLEDLKYYIDKTEGRETRPEYLIELNKQLTAINSKGNAAVYVAFTDYKNELITPIFPEEATTMGARTAYINKLINNKDYSQASQKELESYLNFNDAFKDLIEKIYIESELSKSDAPNIIMPFTNYSIRQVIQKINTNNTNQYTESKGFAYTLYAPKLEQPLNKGKLKAIYNNEIVSLYPTNNNTERIISKIAQSIDTYFYDDSFEYRECEELLEKYKNEPILTDFPEFRKIAEANPCVLNNVIEWGVDIKEKSDWMTMTEKLIVVPLYAVLAIPASTIAGSAILKELGKQKTKDAAMAASINITIQTISNYYFEESVFNETNTNKRWEKALFALDIKDFTKDVIEGVWQPSTRQMAVINCINEGVSIENLDWDNIDISKANVSFSYKDCIYEVVYYLTFEKITEQAGGYLFKKIGNLAQKDPKLFVKAWRELRKDLGTNFKKTIKGGANKYYKDLAKATGISKLSQAAQNYLNASFKMDDAIDEAFSDLASQMGETAGYQFKNLIKDAAIETELDIINATQKQLSNQVTSSIVKQGANVSLDFNINNGKTKIYATLLEKYDDVDGSFRIVFINPSKSSDLDNFLKNTTSGRKAVIEALKGDKTSFKATATLANAKAMGIEDGSEIVINEVVLKTKKANGEFEDDLIVGKNLAGSVFNHLPTSGAIITSNAKQGTFLIGSYPTDLQQILTELNYPKINSIDLNFPVPSGQKFNLLNISDDLYQQYLNSGGGFFTQVNGPWIDAAVNQGRDIIVVSDFQQLYNAAGELTGFGKEVHRLEWVHGYRFDPNTKKMIPQQAGTTLPNKTLQSDYTQN